MYNFILKVVFIAGLKYNAALKYIEGFEEFGELSSNHIADHALVFMIRGMYNNWKMPFAYYFTESGMKTISLVRSIKEVVTAVQSCGLEVMALVCDQGANNSAAINYLKRETREKYVRNNEVQSNICLEINDKPIFHIYDVPHLLKGIRNNLLKGDLVFTMDGEEQRASW